MIIPIKCFTCGLVIADKYRYFTTEVRKRKISDGTHTDTVLYLTQEYTKKTVEGQLLDELNINRMCCRRHFLTHVDIE
jgi:DNA-directed RNA polymerase subunit N (RpoN/RPB10)